MRLIDSHCHIHDSEFFDAEQGEAVYQRAIAADIGMIVVGTDKRSSAAAVQFAKGRDMVWAAVGVHPHDAKDGCETIAELASSSKKVVAIGEIGLDYYYNHSPRETQIAVLEQQLQIAIDNDLPVSFHVRDGFDDFWPIFDNFPGLRGVLHSFTDSRDNAYRAMEKGLYIGINGISTFTKDVEQAQLFSDLPLERIIFETDAPFLTPRPFRGKINEVGFVEHVAKWSADVRGLSLEDVASITLQNTRELFNI